jgi:hypothetical protein
MDEVYPGVYLVDDNEEGGGWRELSWFVDTPAGGVLVNPPAFKPPVARALDQLGAVRYLFVHDRQSLGDVCKFKERYRARIVIHKADAGALDKCKADDRFDQDFSLVQGVRVLVGAGPTPGASLLYVMRDRGYLFPGDLMTLDGERDRPHLRLREAADPRELRRRLLHLRTLHFSAVLPAHSHHPTATHLAAPSEALADALLRGGFYPPSA